MVHEEGIKFSDNQIINVGVATERLLTSPKYTWS